jgi:hypothetical protein
MTPPVPPVMGKAPPVPPLGWGSPSEHPARRAVNKKHEEAGKKKLLVIGGYRREICSEDVDKE